MSDKAQMDRLASAAENALGAMALAHDELMFGGNWVAARTQLRVAAEKLEKALTTARRTLGDEGPRLSVLAQMDTNF